VGVGGFTGSGGKARERLHLHVDREEVDAGVDGLVEHVVEEIATHHPLAEQAAEMVGEYGKNGIDLTLADQGGEKGGVDRRGRGIGQGLLRGLC
jgi:hypothetical protein